MSDVEEVTSCYPCAIGMTAECLEPEETEDGRVIPCGVRYSQRAESVTISRRDGELTSPEDVTDPVSTGRKRAAGLAAILSGMTCEWAGLRHAGGGVIPVVGCAGNLIADKKGGDPEQGYLQGDRHHGPDKATLNNAMGQNLFRICKLCHNRWHVLNDPFYETPRPHPSKPWVPNEGYYAHDPNTEATLEEQEIVDLWWNTPKEKRPAYPITPTGLRLLAAKLDAPTIKEDVNV